MHYKLKIGGSNSGWYFLFVSFNFKFVYTSSVWMLPSTMPAEDWWFKFQSVFFSPSFCLEQRALFSSSLLLKFLKKILKTMNILMVDC